MHCLSFCIANRIDISGLARHFRKLGFICTLYKDVLEWRDHQQVIFYFSNGTVVSWNVNRRHIDKKLELAFQYAQQVTTPMERDYYSYHMGKTTKMKPHEYFNVDLVYLENDDVDLKLALSFGFAQSVKLQMHTRSIEKLVAEYTPYIQQLIGHNTLRVSRQQVLQVIGNIFLVKSSLNLESEFLYTPKFFWLHPSLELYYTKVERYLDISPRVAILNGKLDTLNEVFKMINDQLHTQHSHFLEWIIIVLIALDGLIYFFKM